MSRTKPDSDKREYFDGCLMGGGWGDWVKGEGIKKYKLVVTE